MLTLHAITAQSTRHSDRDRIRLRRSSSQLHFSLVKQRGPSICSGADRYHNFNYRIEAWPALFFWCFSSYIALSAFVIKCFRVSPSVCSVSA